MRQARKLPIFEQNADALNPEFCIVHAMHTVAMWFPNLPYQRFWLLYLGTYKLEFEKMENCRRQPQIIRLIKVDAFALATLIVRSTIDFDIFSLPETLRLHLGFSKGWKV